MIHIGLPAESKPKVVQSYVQEHGISAIVVFGPKRFHQDIGVECEYVEWNDIIKYKYFYRLLQEIDSSTLLVLNECLRTTNRSDLSYNCLRNYLTRTRHQLVFSRFPCLESAQDFMTLVDFDTQSKWRRSSLNEVTEGLNISAIDRAPTIERIDVSTDKKTRERYAAKKRALIDGIGAKDPHTIPRNLHLLAGKHKEAAAKGVGGSWVGRNKRLKVPGLATYKEASDPRQVIEFCHSYREWMDYLTASEASRVPALVSDLRVDEWYFERFTQWTRTQRNAIADIRQHIST